MVHTSFKSRLHPLFYIVGILTLTTVLSGLTLASSTVSADDVVDDIVITVPISCTLSGTGMDTHTATMRNNTYQANIGTTTMKAFCNDPNGFSIYAIGYTNDTYGETHLDSSVDSSYDIATGTATSGNTSNWAMKLNAPNSESISYPLTLDNGFGSYSAVPATFTKVAHRDSGTDTGAAAEGSTLTSTYAAFINTSQPAGTYTGKVKYTLSHPVDQGPPTPYTISYNQNATGTVTNMPTPNPLTDETHASTVSISSTVPVRNGYAFKGWCTVQVADDAACTGTTYNPDGRGTDLNWTINQGSTNNNLTLHAMWWKAAMLDTGRTVNQKLKRLAGNSSASPSTQDNTITTLTRSNTLPSGFTPLTNNIISTSSSTIPIYAWFESGTIYYYSVAPIIVMNRDSSNFFNKMRALSDLSTVSSWNTSSVTNMSNMFYETGYNATTWSIGGLSSWNTSSVTSMSSMFAYAGYNATTWSIGDISSWDTSSVKQISNIFQSAGYRATVFTLNLSSWDTSSVTSMSYMFHYAGRNATTWSVGDLSSWNTSSVTSMNNMFTNAGSGATTWSVGDLSSWNTSSVTDMSSMFDYAGRNATTWSVGDLSSWNTSSVTNMYRMFYYVGYNATTWSIGDLSNWDTSSVTNMSSVFYYAGYNATTWSVGDLSSWNTSSVTNMSSMFYYAGYNATTWSVGDLSSWNTSSVTNMSSMFYYAGYNATTWSIGDLSDWDTSSVTNMSNMFSVAGYNANSFALNLSSWNTSSVTNMNGMFSSAGYRATTWSITIPKTNNGTATGGIANTTTNLYGNSTSVTATPPSGRSFTLAN